MADWVCAAAATGRPIIVGVEYAERNQAALDAYMASDGSKDARLALTDAPLWDPDWADGKSSFAMLALLEWLRTQHQAGVIGRVIAFEPDFIEDGADRERQMAKRLESFSSEDGALFIALTGSFHARKRLLDAETTPYPPMATLLPKARTVSFRIQGTGGRKWACTDLGCGEQDANQAGGEVRKLTILATPDGSYDGVYDLGVPMTPSPPVKQKR
ncbi:hypothetical protein [Sphingobium sp. B7D2B]|uniref:hypothetical protein n=1 Tax=Sphingobium sp. B7D2B TaxID=2940583 RepID=UPI00222482CC|nr:hypothetical protein [Sphingobium sp. B7D2B]